MSSSDLIEKQISRLASEHTRERDEALAWLLDHAAESAPSLRRLVEEGRVDQRTLGAVYLLGQIGEEEDVPVLAATLTAPESKLVWDSAQALGRHRSARAGEVLIGALAHQDPEVVGASVVALGLRGEEAARKPIEGLLLSPDESVRYRAVSALRRLGAGPSRSLLGSHRDAEVSADVRSLIDEALAEENSRE